MILQVNNLQTISVKKVREASFGVITDAFVACVVEYLLEFNESVISSGEAVHRS